MALRGKTNQICSIFYSRPHEANFSPRITRTHEETCLAKQFNQLFPHRVRLLEVLEAKLDVCKFPSFPYHRSFLYVTVCCQTAPKQPRIRLSQTPLALISERISFDEFQHRNVSEMAKYIGKVKDNYPHTKSRHSRQAWIPNYSTKGDKFMSTLLNR